MRGGVSDRRTQEILYNCQRNGSHVLEQRNPVKFLTIRNACCRADNSETFPFVP